MNRKISYKFFLWAVVVLLLWPGSAAALTPKEILRECDHARGNISGVTWEVQVEAGAGKKTSHRRLRVRVRSYNVIAETRSPARRRGQMLILLNGNMWFYKPGLSKPVPVSKRQKLLGLANNGDIASTNYAENYKVLNQDMDRFDHEPCYVFTLEAKSSKATYKLIKYWVSIPRLVGVKAEFYTSRGRKLLKSARMKYENQIAVDGGKLQPFISQMIIRDELMSVNTTVLDFSSPSLEPVPASAFNLNLLKR